MAWIEEQRERERLGRMYGEMADGELLGLAAKQGDLTEAAQGVLAEEMGRRGLELPRLEQDEVQDLDGDAAEGGSGWRTLHVFSQAFEARAAFALMEREEIEFAVEDRAVDENGDPVPGPAIQLALTVKAADWERSVRLLRREAGLFPEAVENGGGELDEADEVEGAEEEMVAVGEFEEEGDLGAAVAALGAAGVVCRTVKHEDEEWKRTSVEVRAEDADRALEVLEKLLEEDASRL